LSQDSPPRIQPKAFDGPVAVRAHLSDDAAFKLRKRLLNGAAIALKRRHGIEINTEVKSRIFRESPIENLDVKSARIMRFMTT
jgi:hypothetical protein